MNKITFASLCVAALATSCSNDLGVESTRTVELSASVSVEKTRGAFGSDGSFYWQSGDQIGVTTKSTDASSENETFTAFTLESGAGDASATFKGDIAGKLGSYAIYPYDAAQKIANGTLTYTFPSAYTYSKVDQTFFPTEKNGNSFRPAMFAKIENNSVAFKHLGGVFCVKIASMPYASGTLTLTTDQKLCGEYTATVTEDTPELKLNTTESATDNKSVTITFQGATTGQPGVFYIPVPTGTYTNATVSIKEGSSNSNDETKEKTIVAGTYVVNRKNLKVLSIKTASIDATTAEDANAATTSLASSDNVAITGEVATNTTISIPAASTEETASTSSKTLSLQKVTSGAAITVADQNSSSTETSKSVKELTVSIPNTTSEEAPSVTVSMPNTTVTLAGNAGEATFNKVTATTAENTLVVSSGVTIKELEIAKGNVRINKGATVEKITLATGTSSAKIYCEDGATLPESLPEGATKGCIVETDAQFAAAAKNDGANILLAASDVAYTLPTTMGNNVTITGAGTDNTKVAAKTAVAYHDKNITFENLTYENSSDNYIGLQHTTSVSYKNCVITGRPTMYATTAKFENCTFKQAIYDYCIWTYGSKNITFTDCTFDTKGKAVKIYSESNNLVQNATFTNCTFKASDIPEGKGKAAIEVDATLLTSGQYTINITNCTAETMVEGEVSKNKLWNVDNDSHNTTIKVDNKQVYPTTE